MKDRPEQTKESRRAVRRAVDIPCEVVFANRDEPVACQARDLSPYGVWIETTELAEPGDKLVLSFRPPNWPSIFSVTVFGEVVRVSRGRRKVDRGRTGMAIEFVDLTEAEQQALAECIRGLPPPLPRWRND